MSIINAKNIIESRRLDYSITTSSAAVLLDFLVYTFNNAAVEAPLIAIPVKPLGNDGTIEIASIISVCQPVLIVTKMSVHEVLAVVREFEQLINNDDDWVIAASKEDHVAEKGEGRFAYCMYAYAESNV